MNRKIVNILLALLMLFLPLAMRGQVSIRLDKASKSRAEIGGEYEAGDYRKGDDARSQWKAGASVSSLQSLEKMTLAGSFSYTQTEFSEKSGSMFINPGFYPFEIYEFTPGHKTLQTYSMKGGLSVDLADKWCLGGEITYLSENIAKRKDLRHSNYRLDMSVSPGVMYHNGDLALAAFLTWSRNAETINAEQIGSNTSGYKAFLNKGAYYGVSQIWTGSGIHLSEAGVTGFPVRENIYGAGAEVFFKDLKVSVRIRKRDGSAGEKQTIWFRFPGWDLRSSAQWTYASGSLRHTLSAAFNILNQTNYETVLDKETEGGITLTHEYGSNLLSRRRNTDAFLAYNCYGEGWNSGLKLLYVCFDWRVAPYYPYLAKNTVRRPGAELSFGKQLGKFDLGLRLGGSLGYVTDRLRKYSTQTGVKDEPVRLESSYLRYEEYCSRSTMTVAPHVKYNLSHGLYLVAEGYVLHAFGVELLKGSNRVCAGLKLGYLF